MTNNSITQSSTPPAVLITGASVRIGASIVKLLHQQGYNILLHYNRSQVDAEHLAEQLNSSREDSVHCIQADLLDSESLKKLAIESINHWGRLDVLINNASSFFPTPLAQASEQDWQELMGTNAKAPFILLQHTADALITSQGCVINITDIYAKRGLKEHCIYAMAKAALTTMTKVMARDLAPHVRVNAIAPGAILWPENIAQENTKHNEDFNSKIIQQTCLGHIGKPEDIANTVLFLIEQASYITGQTISVDGGRSLLI